MTGDPARFALVRSLRGSVAQVLLAFLFSGGSALDVDDVRLWTGLERHSVYDALKALASMGLLMKQTGGHGRLVWLPSGQALLELLQMEENPPSERQVEEKPPSGGGNSSSSRSTTAFSLNQVNTNKAVVERQVEGIPPPGEETVMSEELVQANLAACAEHEIGEPNASKIARADWVTPEFIHVHVRDLLERESIGLAIIRILGNETPRSWAKQRRRSPAERERELADAWQRRMAGERGAFDEYLGSGVAAETGPA